MVQDLPKEENQELVIQDHKKLERYTSDLGSNRMDDNTVTVYIARRPKNEIKGKEISKEKEMQEERLVESETEEKSKGTINSIIPFEEIKGNEFVKELGYADMMEGLEDIEAWDDLEAFNEFGEELELEQKKENSSNMECNVITLPIEFMAKQNIIEDEEHSSKGSNAQGACHILLTDEEMKNLESKAEAELEFPPSKIIFEKPSKIMSQHLKPFIH